MREAPRVVVVKDYDARQKIISYLSPLVYLGIVVLVSMPFVFTMQVMGTGTTTSAGVFISIIMMIVANSVVLYFYRHYGWADGWREAWGLTPSSKKTIVFAAIAGVLLFGCLQLVVSLVANVIGTVDSSETSKAVIGTQGFIFWITMGLLVPVVVPVLEELVFRGAILGAFVARGKQWVGIVFTALLFGALHLEGTGPNSLVLGVWITFMGIILGWVRVRTKSVYPSIAIHVAYNSVTSLIVLFGLVS